MFSFRNELFFSNVCFRRCLIVFFLLRYKRRGESCLGIDAKKQCISWDSTASEKKQLQRRPERYFSKNNVKSLNTDGIPVCNKSSPSDPAAFIPVFHVEASDPSDTTEVNPLGIYDPSTTEWLQGKGYKGEEHEPVNTQQAFQEPGINVNPILMTKVEEHNKKVRENPRDIQAWMNFVSFQVCVLTGSLFLSNKYTNIFHYESATQNELLIHFTSVSILLVMILPNFVMIFVLFKG